MPAEIVRQLRNLNDKELDKRIAEVWGIVRTTPADRARLIADWKRKLNAPAPPADLALGRRLFAKTCMQCHTLYGVGGKVGPDITGSNRGNLDYLLENILDPSAVIPNDYKATLIDLEEWPGHHRHRPRRDAASPHRRHSQRNADGAGERNRIAAESATCR